MLLPLKLEFFRIALANRHNNKGEIMFDFFQLPNAEKDPYGFSDLPLVETTNINQINSYFPSETLPPLRDKIESLEINQSSFPSEVVNSQFDLLTGIGRDGDLSFIENDATPPQNSFKDFVAYTVERGINPLDIYYDEAYYLANNPDVVRVISNGLYRNGFDHLIRTGLLQGRNPSPLYNETIYLSENPDVAAAVARGEIRSGLEHFLQFGFYEGRDRRAAQFDEEFYLAANPGVAEAVENGIFNSGFEHFVVKGESEGRQGRAV